MSSFAALMGIAWTVSLASLPLLSTCLAVFSIALTTTLLGLALLIARIPPLPTLDPPSHPSAG